MLRLTTNVTVVAGQLGAQLVGRLAHVLDRLGARLGEQRGQLVLASARRRRAPFAIAPGTRSRRIGRSSRRPEPRRGMKLQYLQLDHVEHALLHPLRVHVLRVDAEPLGERVAARLRAACASGAATGTGARARCGRRSPTARRGRSRPPRRAAATSRRGSAGSGSPTSGISRWHSRTSSAHVVERDRRGPGRQRQPARRASPRALRLVGDLAPAPRRSSAGAARSSGGSPPGCGRTRRAPRRAPRSASIRSSGDSPIPTRIPLVNGIRSSPAARMRLEPHAPGAWSASPGGRPGPG